MIERYSAREVSLDRLRSTVDEITARWQSASDVEKPPFADRENALWHVVWQLESACHEELAPDGVRIYLDYLDGAFDVPAGGSKMRP